MIALRLEAILVGNIGNPYGCAVGRGVREEALCDLQRGKRRGKRRDKRHDKS